MKHPNPPQYQQKNSKLSTFLCKVTTTTIVPYQNPQYPPKKFQQTPWEHTPKKPKNHSHLVITTKHTKTTSK
jgi:hypothetical protein